MQNQNKFVGNLQSFAPPSTSSTEFPPLYTCCNFHHFGITKRIVMASKLQVTASKLQVTASKLQVTASKPQVMPTKLQVTRLKFTSLTADTNKFQLTNMLFAGPFREIWGPGTKINLGGPFPFCFRFQNNQNTAADLQMFLNYAINRAINRTTIGIQQLFDNIFS